MNKKRRNIIIIVIVALAIILTLWISGIIPKQIAKIYATQYFKKNFPKIQLEYENIEWAASFGDYIITFKDENNKQYKFIIGPKYFPVNLGQGMFSFEEQYREKYGEQIENDNMKSQIKAVVVEVNKNYLLAMGIGDTTSLYSIGITDEENIEFKQGQELLIYFNGTVMESYPAHLGNVGKIEIIKEKSEIEIPDNILRYCYSSTESVTVSVNKLTKSSISLTIKDTNELPYEYSNDYTIYKKVKNENYTGIGYQIGENTGNSTAGYTRNRS